MSDWEIVDDNIPQKQSVAKQLLNNSDWEVVNNNVPEQESFGSKLSNAASNLVTDLGQSALSGLNAIPDYYQAAKKEVPGLISSFQKDPFGTLSQGYAGAAEQGKNVFNFPHDVINYLSQRLKLVPEDINKIIQMSRMPDEETKKMINQTFGKPKLPGQKLFRGLNRNEIAITGLGSLGKNVLSNTIQLRHALNRIDKDKVAASIQNSHDVLENRAINRFNKVGNEAVKRNSNVIPIRKDLISDIEKHLPKTKANKMLLDNARNGDYHGLRDLQSDLFHRSNKALKSQYMADNNIGELLKELREEVNNSIENHFVNKGHLDLAKELNKGRREYRQLKETYYGKKTHSGIQNLVHPESRKVPDNLMKILSENSKPMERVRNSNPFAEKYAHRYQERKKAINRLKTLTGIGIGSATLGGLFLEAPALYDQFLKSKQE